MTQRKINNLVFFCTYFFCCNKVWVRFLLNSEHRYVSHLKNVYLKLLILSHPQYTQIRVTKTGCSIWTSPVFALNPKELILPWFSFLQSPCMQEEMSWQINIPWEKLELPPQTTATFLVTQKHSLPSRDNHDQPDHGLHKTACFAKLFKPPVMWTFNICLCSLFWNVKAWSIRWGQVLGHCPLSLGMATVLLWNFLPIFTTVISWIEFWK